MMVGQPAGRTGGASDLALIWHSSDVVVKPIVANRRIERLPEPRFSASELPFTPLSLQVTTQACRFSHAATICIIWLEINTRASAMTVCSSTCEMLWVGGGSAWSCRSHP